MNINRQEKTVYVEIEPELLACVETKAKREYNQILSELLKEGEKEEPEERLEILRLFIESADFSKLRSESKSTSWKGNGSNLHCTW